MKKLMTVATLLTLSTSAFAGYQGNNTQSGYTGGNVATVTTVAKAKRAYDNTPASISGYIVKQIDEDTFIFKDSTGQIQIDVDDDAWNGLNVSAKNKVRIYGEVDKDDGRTQIDVHRISK
ncbi:NirD/YgiW/YdeI family stress tolerance protein [Actinobacillus indolicus]|uniref:NirD/YgiW/YdeI family stress tolerance protein n=1 Tax=Actinobacillus indolicus TaxID=51049 RepID=A0A4P7CMH6_9PAST|nr:NirD/YgiW/YdeI family stress tolerance protein [Actinobacillus indolicus]QBQ64381.1 NirD/YgiW/YdeI family stress tolerance protein [Actinobacillus indolicus]VFY95261.1 Uncharacterized conserved protein [Actinobacillus indolicus]VTU08043.1 Uncharacterized conserved protein [Actinobacillus indolicus]